MNKKNLIWDYILSYIFLYVIQLLEINLYVIYRSHIDIRTQHMKIYIYIFLIIWENKNIFTCVGIILIYDINVNQTKDRVKDDTSV